MPHSAQPVHQTSISYDKSLFYTKHKFIKLSFWTSHILSKRFVAGQAMTGQGRSGLTDLLTGGQAASNPCTHKKTGKQTGRQTDKKTLTEVIKLVHSQTQNRAQWLAACGHVSTSSQSLCPILSLRMNKFYNLVPLMLELTALGWLKSLLHVPDFFVLTNCKAFDFGTSQNMASALTELYNTSLVKFGQ